MEQKVAKVGAGPLVHLQPWLAPAAGLLTVTANGQLMYYHLASGSLTSLVNSSLAVTSLAVNQAHQRVFVGDTLGRLHVMDNNFVIIETVVVCPGESVDTLEMFRSEASGAFKGLAFVWAGLTFVVAAFYICRVKLDICRGRLDIFMGRLYICRGRLDICMGRLDICRVRLDICRGRLDICRGRLDVYRGSLDMFNQ